MLRFVVMPRPRAVDCNSSAKIRTNVTSWLVNPEPLEMCLSRSPAHQGCLTFWKGIMFERARVLMFASATQSALWLLSRVSPCPPWYTHTFFSSFLCLSNAFLPVDITYPQRSFHSFSVYWRLKETVTVIQQFQSRPSLSSYLRPKLWAFPTSPEAPPRPKSHS